MTQSTRCTSNSVSRCLSAHSHDVTMLSMTCSGFNSGFNIYQDCSIGLSEMAPMAHSPITCLLAILMVVDISSYTGYCVVLSARIFNIVLSVAHLMSPPDPIRLPWHKAAWRVRAWTPTTLLAAANLRSISLCVASYAWHCAAIVVLLLYVSLLAKAALLVSYSYFIVDLTLSTTVELGVPLSWFEITFNWTLSKMVNYVI